LITFATRAIVSTLDDVHAPAVQNALDQGLNMSLDLMRRQKNDLRQRGQLLVADPVMSLKLESIDPEAVRGRLATAYNMDFVQIYSTEGDLLLEVTRDPLLASLGSLPEVLERVGSEHPFLEREHSSGDVLAYVGYGGVPGESEWILLAGIYLDAGFYQRRANLVEAFNRYSKRLPGLIKFRQTVVLIILAALVVALALGSTWIARRLAARVSRPIQTLGAGMERVARGDEAVHVSPQGTQEMERLIGTFNTMSTELSRSRRELARAERLSAWRDVARRVAHEIKNALTPITFSAHRIRKDAAGLEGEQQERLRASLDTVLEEVEGLNLLAASFSELARLPVPEFTPVDLCEVVHKTASAFTGEKDRLVIRTPDAPVTVEGDRTLLRQALTNVIKNAIEATGDGDRIWVEVEPDTNQARIVVEDEGPGWPEEERDTSLSPYVTTKAEGTGLGLSLVQRTMLQHGGSVELGDRAEGGARVTLVLPRRVSGSAGVSGGGRSNQGQETS
jgi:nitrogen fixation/metabolism regulation signal transduction histidine kinase